MNKKYLAGIFCLAFAVASCQNGKNTAAHSHEGEHNHAHDEATEQAEHMHEEEHDHSHEAEHAHGEEKHSTDEIVLEAAKAEKAGVKSEVINPADFNEVIKVSGKIMPARGEEQVITAPTDGNVLFVSNISEGSSVGKGKCVAHISTKRTIGANKPEYITVRYEVAKKEYERAATLVKDNIVSEKEYNDARQEYEQAKVDYETLMRGECSDGLSVSSAMNGYVKSFMADNGAYVQAGQPIMTVTQTRKLYLRADVSERHYDAMRNVQTANFRTSYDDKVYDLSEMAGRIVSAGKSVDDNSPYIPLTFEFNNTGNIIPGTYADIYLISSPLKNVISLPVDAIVEDQGHFFVYRKTCTDSYTKQEVTLGNNNGRRVQILTGVNPGDEIVTAGAYQIKLASASSSIPAHSHEH